MREDDLKKDLSARLAQLGRDQQERIARSLAENAELPYINLTVFPVDQDALSLLPREQAQAVGAAVFYKSGKDLRLAVTNPKSDLLPKVVSSLEEKTGVPPQLYVVSARSLASVFPRYRQKPIEEKPEGVLEVSAEAASQQEKALENFVETSAKMSPTELLQTIVINAVAAGASDLHLEPKEKNARLRYRIDGVLQDVAEVPVAAWRLLLSRVKILSKLKLNIKNTPQDGSFVLQAEDKIYDIRVSILPGDVGENIVMRILDRDTNAVSVKDLGMKQRDFEVVSRHLEQSTGMILVTGPTGSGKTTSLASFLQAVNSEGIKIITLENPIEYRLPGVEQTEIDAPAGYTFAKGLRAILRQDPDIIMVGEIRDNETAETAMHAALTGHLVFSTLHTNDAPGSIPRLADMGVAPNIVAPALNLIIAQRLLRVVCKQCATETDLTPTLQERITDAMSEVSAEYFKPQDLKDKKIMEAKGCEACGGTGYQGRIGVFEVMPIERELEELILAGADTNKVRDEAIKQGMTTIVQDAWLKVLDQVTTIAELERVTEE